MTYRKYHANTKRSKSNKKIYNLVKAQKKTAKGSPKRFISSFEYVRLLEFEIGILVEPIVFRGAGGFW